MCCTLLFHQQSVMEMFVKKYQNMPLSSAAVDRLFTTGMKMSLLFRRSCMVSNSCTSKKVLTLINKYTSGNIQEFYLSSDIVTHHPNNLARFETGPSRFTTCMVLRMPAGLISNHVGTKSRAVISKLSRKIWYVVVKNKLNINYIDLHMNKQFVKTVNYLKLLKWVG